MSADPDRQTVYDAEDAAFEGTPLADKLTEESITRLYHEVLDSDWWGARPRPAIHQARVDMIRWGGIASGVRGFIKTAAKPASRDVVSHELAHIVHYQELRSAGQPHGVEFRTYNVQTVSHIFGRQYGELLLDAYQAHGLDVSDVLLAPVDHSPVIDIDALALATAPTGGWRRPS